MVFQKVGDEGGQPPVEPVLTTVEAVFEAVHALLFQRPGGRGQGLQHLLKFVPELLFLGGTHGIFGPAHQGFGIAKIDGLAEKRTFEQLTGIDHIVGIVGTNQVRGQVSLPKPVHTTVVVAGLVEF